MDIAITRDVSPALERCELTHVERVPIDLARARAQHEDYCARLERLGLEVVRLPAAAELPDCCFVEDAAVVLDELAVIAMPGAPSRRPELPAVEAALARYRRLERIALPATLDGGDVLLAGRRILVGLTTRTNAAGIEALRAAVAPHGYTVEPVRAPGCLHLKSAVTALDAETLVANRAWLEPGALAGFRVVDVDPAEPGAANALRVRGELWLHAGHPRTRERLERAGYSVTPVDISEFVKAEAALTCKSLIFRR